MKKVDFKRTKAKQAKNSSKSTALHTISGQRVKSLC